MSRDIKTRRTKKDIKVLDKVAVGREHFRNAYVQVKDIDARTKGGDEYGSPTNYAEDQVSGAANRIAGKAVNYAKQQGSKTIRKIKNKRHGKESVLDGESSAAESAGTSSEGSAAGEMTAGSQTKAAEDRENQVLNDVSQKKEAVMKNRKKETVRAAELSSGKIKTRPAVEKTIKQPEHSIGRPIKSMAKGNIKTGKKSIKTAEQTAKTTIKTMRQGAQSAQQTVQMTTRAAQKAAQAAQKAVQNSRQAVKAAAKTAKAAAKATVSAVKAMIASVKSLVTAITVGGWIAILIILVMVLFGGFLVILGGNNSSSASSVSEEVQAYDSVIRKYSAQHGIPKYVELIKAVMMQESGGHGSDPMQASECGYNTKYPNTPNGITDPEYSIDVGIQNLADCLQQAGAQNPVDLDNIKTALQGYKFETYT